MGVKKEIPKDIDGISYAKYFKDGTGSVPSEQFILGAIMSNNAKANTGFRGIRNTNYKLAYQQKKNGTQDAFLFNIKNDPFELNNLYKSDDKQVIELKLRLEEWLKKTNDTFVIQ
jgi:arylsulfatase A-like enzyme